MRIVLLFLCLSVLACSEPDKRPRPITETFAGQAVQDPELRRLIVIETEAYWAAISAGDWERAYARFTDGYREKVNIEEWRRLHTTARAAKPRIIEIRWTKAAQRHHGPELYAIVNWRARAATAGFAGTLIWRQGSNGSFKLENTEVRGLKPGRG